MSPLSKDPRKRARQLANLRPAPPAPEGHTRSLVHGGRARKATLVLAGSWAERAKVAAYLDACGTGRRTEGPAKPAAKRTMPRVVAPVNEQGADLLPIRGKAPVR